MDQQQLTRIGIIGTARISRKNIEAILHPSSGCIVTALASRNLDRAKDFVKNCVDTHRENDKLNQKLTGCDIKIFGGDDAYDELITSDDLVDAVYIPLPTSICKKWVIQSLQNQKHVLVEKPVALNSSDYHEMVSTALQHHKYIQDGTMFIHNPRTKEFLRTVSDVDIIGNIRHLRAAFSFAADERFLKEDIRTKADGDPLGCIGDLGWYCVRMAILVFDSIVGGKGDDDDGGCLPLTAQAVHYETNEFGVPIDVTCLVHFEKGLLFTFHCNFFDTLHQTFEVYGSKKVVSVSDFVLPTLITKEEGGTETQFYNDSFEMCELIRKGQFKIQNKDTITSATAGEPAQEVRMWSNFDRIARALDSTNPSTASHNDGGGVKRGWKSGCEHVGEGNKLLQTSLKTQMILDALMESLNNDGKKIELSVN